VLATLTFLTPSGALLALAVVLPFGAFTVSAVRRARGRALLGLVPPPPGREVVLAALAAVPLLLGLAAAGPALRTHVGGRVRTDAEAIFVFDVSRSMSASAGPRSRTRFAQAETAALELRDAIPEVPSGVASLSNELLPHLFPTADKAAFATTIEEAIGIDKPAPLGAQVLATSFVPLAYLANQGFFKRSTTHRIAVLLTDGESAPFYTASVGQALHSSPGIAPGPGNVQLRPEPPVSLLVVRLGSADDRIYDAAGKIEAAYRPQPTAASVVESLAASAGGSVFTSRHLASAAAALRKQMATGRTSRLGTSTELTSLAPYAALAALIPLLFILWGRNFAKL
jgi:hypothetical protein